ncbi:MAG TPA: hypothetical protein VEB59_14340 [Gemmatimonadales bacterium]|nr:hypothetical protein [Gemmatimonadales bacterium]
MKALLLLSVVVLSLSACSSGRGDSSATPPATVKVDSTGMTVDTTKADSM